MSVIPEFGRLEQEDREFKGSLRHRVNLRDLPRPPGILSGEKKKKR